MLASLEVRGVTINRKERDPGVPDYDTVSNSCGLSRKESKDLIPGQVSPGILARLGIPRSSIKSTEILLSRLEGVATPFRLLDLPAELRDQVYSYHFDQLLPRTSVVFISLQDTYGVPRPAICRANRQLRQETAHLVYGRPTYSLCRNYQSMDSGTDVVKAIRRWKSTIPAQHIRLFLSIELQSATRFLKISPANICRYKPVRFDYSPKLGLNMHSEDLKGPPIKLLADYIARVARDSGGEAAEGNLIFRAMTSEPNLWDVKGPLRDQDI